MKKRIYGLLSLRKYLINIKFKVFKSAAAVFISLYIAKLLKLPDLLSPAFVAVLCIQPTVYTGIRRGLQEFFVSLLGAIFSLIFVLPYGINLITVPLTVAFTIYVAIKLHLDDSISIAIFTVLYITLFPGESVIKTTEIRFFSIVIGILSASFVNYLVSFVRYKYLFYTRLLRASEIIYIRFNQLVDSIYDKDVETLNSLLPEIDQIYKQLSNLKKELNDIRKEINIRKRPGGMSVTAAFYMERILSHYEVIIHHLYDLCRTYNEIFNSEHKIPKFIENRFISIIENLLRYIRNLYKVLNNRDINLLNNEEIKLDTFQSLMNKVKTNKNKENLFTIKLFSIIINLQNISLSISQIRRLIVLYLKEIKIK